MTVNRLEVLNNLLTMVKGGEINTGMEQEDVEWALLSIREMVEESLYRNILADITDAETSYFAPEHGAWMDFLDFCNGYPDYKEILEKKFSEAELDSLWRCSHPDEDLSREQMMIRAFAKLCELKMNDVLESSGHNAAKENKRRIDEMLKATIKGIYNILYESVGDV